MAAFSAVDSSAALISADIESFSSRVFSVFPLFVDFRLSLLLFAVVFPVVVVVVFPVVVVVVVFPVEVATLGTNSVT